MKVLITTVPFGDKNKLPLDILEELGIEYLVNPTGKKLTEVQLADMVSDFDIIVAGTEPITEYVMSKAKNLKMISRVGIGLDSVDLLAAEKRGIKVSYTPDAPSPAVAELTIGMIITLLRSVHLSNLQMHNGEWSRYFGKRIANATIGIIGLGRIGTRVLNRLSVFGTPRLLVNDINRNKELNHKFKLEWVSKEKIYQEADIISLHLPLTARTKNMICQKELKMMKSDASIINTSRGGIINERDLYDVMKKGHLSGVAIDVFDNEPYSGKLSEIERCLLTAHLGSMSIDCRTQMEIEATEEAIRFISNKPLISEVPNAEYEVQREGL
jgi:D-3-phosphoglycerate dehydrogenase